MYATSPAPLREGLLGRLPGLRRLLGPTPNRLAMIGLSLLLLFGLTAVAGGLAAWAAVNAGHDMVVSAARMSGNAQTMYRSLAEADAAATGRFLAPPDSPHRDVLDARFQLAISEVRRVLGDSAGYTGGDPDRAANLARIANQLPVYLALVEKAQQLARDPRSEPKSALLGAAYLREASGYLRQTLLTAAQRLWDDETARLREARRDAQLALGASVGISLLTIAALWWSQRYLRRRTRRRVNPGLAAATAAMVGVLGWLAVSWSHWPRADQRLAAAGQQLAADWELIGLQRRALEARADDHLRLGGNSNQYGMDELQRMFREKAGCGRVEEAPAGLAELLVAWCAAHDDGIHHNEVAGEHNAAVAAALPGGNVAAAFEAYDRGLAEEIGRRNEAVHAELAGTPRPADPSGDVILLLCLVAAVSASAGIWVRLREYQ